MDDNEIRMDRSRRQEKEGAKAYSGKTVRGSGSGRMKGDIDSKYFRIECKRTDKKQKSITVTQAFLEKIEEEAFGAGKLPALEIEIGSYKPWVIIRREEFQNLIAYFKEFGDG